VEWSLQFRLLVVVLAAVLVFFGIGRFNDMPVDVYPEFAPVSVEVRSEALGLSAQEVSEFITAPLEADLLSNVPWVDIVRSESVPGLSSVELIFEPGTDLLQARQVVQERVAEAAIALPGASKPPEMLQPRSSTSRLMMIGLSSNELSLIDLSVLARWSIRPRLLGVEGVSNVSIWGQREKQLQVQVDPARLQSLQVPLLQIIETTANALWSSPLSFVEAAVPGTGGWIDTPNQRLGVQHISPITTPQDLAQVTLEERPALRLSDLANVVEDHQPLIGDAILKDGPGLILVVEKWPDANTLEVTKAVDEALAAMAPGLGPVDIDPNLYRPAAYVQEAADNLTIASIAAAVLILLVLAAFLLDWRTALMSAVTIPLSLFVAVNVLSLLGEGLNVVVVGGLVAALVFLIDDAVLSANSIWRGLHASRDTGEATSTVIGRALSEVHGPLLFATLAILVGLLPLFALNGLAGEFFPSIALAYGVAIVASVTVTALVAPALALILFPNQPHSRWESPLAATLSRAYRAGLPWLLGRPMLALALAGVAIIVGIGSVTQLSEPSLLPAVKERNLLIQWEGAPGTSQPAMTQTISEVANRIGALAGVANVGAHVGRAITSDQVVGISSAEIWVTIAAGADYDETLAALEDIIEGYPGLARGVQTYPEKQVEEVLTGSARDVVVRVYGDDFRALRNQAEAVRAALADIDGVVEPVVDLPPEEPTIEIQVDLAAAQLVGIKPGDVRRSAATLLSGLLVGNLFEEQKVFEVVVWSTPETRSSVESVQNLLIDTPTGSFVPLSQVADVRVEPNPSVIKREAVSLYIDVTADVDGRSIGAVESEIRERIRGLNFPIEYHAEIATDKAGGYRAFQTSVLPYAIAAAAGVFLLLQAALSSWRLAAMAFVLLPVALVGGVIAAWIDGGQATIGSYIGLVAVLGLSVRSGLALITRYQALEQEAGGTFDAELALRGAADRLLPLVMTALAGVLAMLAVIVSGDIPGLEVIRPLAIVLVGGLISLALLHLFILPALYLRFWRRTQQEAAPHVINQEQPRIDEGGGRDDQARPAPRLRMAMVAFASLLVLACSETLANEAPVSPSKVEPIPGSSVSKVTLLESAAERIAIQTTALSESSPGPRGEPGPSKVLPYSAVIYDLMGATWVYTNPEPLTYVREPITIAYVQLDTAVLAAGPDLGTRIVTVGAAELYGAETGVR
jgi:Cu/Ag efflux pump CusA